MLSRNARSKTAVADISGRSSSSVNSKPDKNTSTASTSESPLRICSMFSIFSATKLHSKNGASRSITFLPTSSVSRFSHNARACENIFGTSSHSPIAHLISTAHFIKILLLLFYLTLSQNRATI